MAQVVFDIDAWRLKYPKLSEKYTDDELQAFFDRAALLILDNTDSSIVKSVSERAALYDLLVCHLATLTARGTDVTGSLTSASEGSVSAGYTSPQTTSLSSQWYAQTQCGWLYYLAMRKYVLGGRYRVCRTVH